MTKLEVQREVLKCIQELGIDEAVKIGVSAFREKSAELQKAAQKERKDFRLHNTKLILKNYIELKAHAREAIDESSLDYWQDLMLVDGGRIDIKEIRMSIAKTRLLLAHVDAMLAAYKDYCEAGSFEVQRRWRCLSAMYLEHPQLSVNEIAERECISVRQVYIVIDAACDQLGVFLYGVDAVSELFEAFGPD